MQFVCVSVCVCVRLALLVKKKMEPNGCTDLDADFAKRLFTKLAKTLLKLVTMGFGHSDSISIFLHKVSNP